MKTMILIMIAVSGTAVAYIFQRRFAHGNAFSFSFSRPNSQLPLADAGGKMPPALAVTNRQGLILWATPGFSAMTGYGPAAVAGMSILQLSSGLYPPQTLERIKSVLRAGESWQGPLVSRRRDGSLFTEFRTIIPVRGEHGEVSHLLISLQRGPGPSPRRTAAAVREDVNPVLTGKELLTGMPGRSELQEYLSEQMLKVSDGVSSTLLHMDVDHLKAVNDVWGYAVGDVVLIEITRLISEKLGTGGAFYRMAGDEFAVVLTDADVTQAAQFADRISTAVQQMNFGFPTMAPSVSLSIGIVPLDAAEDVETLLWVADAALLKAKETGKNRHVTYKTTAEVDRTFSETTFWAYRIKEAVENDQFELFLQPIVEMNTENPLMAEALLRMRDEHGGVVAPGAFLPAATRFGQLGLIDRIVVKLALKVLADNPQCIIFVNISGASMGDTEFLSYVKEELKRSKVAPGRLGFEITETVAITNLAAALHLMNRLGKLGCLFALDDFGTGFSTFAYLQELPVQYIKIDGSLIDGVGTSDVQTAIVQAIVTLSQALGKKLIAEQVVNDGVRRTLLAMGVKYGQGHHFCPAASVPEILSRYGRAESAV